ncbi:hypothetical protein GGF46_002427 [Coemansia sp. RSA 552]|nr:hypothetical protein GGF46_002427 [Coemansia sp. RSA 552]
MSQTPQITLSSDQGRANDNSTEAPAGAKQERSPIPITMPGGGSQRDAYGRNPSAFGNRQEGIYNTLQPGAGQSGSMYGSSGIEAPPNSLAAQPHLAFGGGQSAGANQTTLGYLPPPNTPARSGLHQQAMAGMAAGGGGSSSGSAGAHGPRAGQVPTGSYIDRSLHGMKRLDEEDEDKMDQDEDTDFNDASPSASFHPGDHRRESAKDSSDGMFEMD